MKDDDTRLHNEAGLRYAAAYENRHKEAARQFCKLLREELGEEILAVVVGRNSEETNPNVCHSHDFCDANMVMDAAMRAAGFHMDFTDQMPDDIVEAFNSAWDLAKAAKFDADQVAK